MTPAAVEQPTPPNAAATNALTETPTTRQGRTGSSTPPPEEARLANDRTTTWIDERDIDMTTGRSETRQESWLGTTPDATPVPARTPARGKTPTGREVPATRSAEPEHVALPTPSDQEPPPSYLGGDRADDRAAHLRSTGHEARHRNPARHRKTAPAAKRPALIPDCTPHRPGPRHSATQCTGGAQPTTRLDKARQNIWGIRHHHVFEYFAIDNRSVPRLRLEQGHAAEQPELRSDPLLVGQTISLSTTSWNASAGDKSRSRCGGHSGYTTKRNSMHACTTTWTSGTHGKQSPTQKKVQQAAQLGRGRRRPHRVARTAPRSATSRKRSALPPSTLR